MSTTKTWTCGGTQVFRVEYTTANRTATVTTSTSTLQVTGGGIDGMTFVSNNIPTITYGWYINSTRKTTNYINATTQTIVTNYTANTTDIFNSTNKNTRTAHLYWKWGPVTYNGSTDSSQITSVNYTVTLNAPPTFNSTNVVLNGPAYVGCVTATATLSNLSAKYGADISSAVLKIGNQTATRTTNGSFDPFTLTAAGTFTPTVTVTDSRGQVTTTNLTPITILPYVAPAINNFRVERTTNTGVKDDEGNSAVIATTFNYTDAVANLTEPTITVTDSNNTTITPLITWYSDSALTTIINENDWSSVAKNTEVYALLDNTFHDLFDTQHSYQISITPNDIDINNVTHSGATITQTLGSAYYTVDFLAGGHGIAFGSAATHEGMLIQLPTGIGQNLLFPTVNNTNVIDTNNYQLIIGKNNTQDNNQALIIGNGSDISHPSNIFTVDWDGNLSTNSIRLTDNLTMNNSKYLRLNSGAGSQYSWNQIWSSTYAQSGHEATSNLYIQADGYLAFYVGNDTNDPTGRMYLYYDFLLVSGYISTSSYVRANSGFYCNNNNWYHCKNTGGTDRLLCGINGSNAYMFGYGGYANNEGSTYLDGNVIYLRSKGAVSITGTVTTSSTVTAGGKLTVSSGGAAITGNLTVSGYGILTGTTTTDSSANARIGTGSPVGRIYRSTASSRRFKHEIQPLTKADLDPHQLYSLPIRQFKYNIDYLDFESPRFGLTVPGFIAEEMYDVYPIAVDLDNEKRPEDWNVRYVVPPMLALIQEQHQEIEELKERISILEEK